MNRFVGPAAPWKGLWTLWRPYWPGEHAQRARSLADDEWMAGVCEYCGCQALEAIATLTAQHDLVVNLAGETRRALLAGDLDLAADRARAVAAVLVPHTAVEEGALFPAMADEFGTHVTALIDEHRRIEDALTESATATPRDPEWPARLERVLWLLREHILKEEDGVFPAALAVLDPAQWDAVDAVRARVGSGLRAEVEA
jgi:hemerythrin-like domain-containing protein